MRRIAKSCILIAFALLLVGCKTTTFGNSQLNDPSRYIQLKENESTKADVYDIFGQPHDVRATSADDVTWVYYKIDMRISGWTFVPFVGMVAGGSSRDMTFSYFSFDSSNTLKKVETLNSNNDYENMWAGIGRGVSRISDRTQAERVEQEMQANGFPFDPEIAKKVRDIRDE